jgi:GAF domain-containing protein
VPPPTEDVLHVLARFLVADAPVGDTLRRVVELSVEAVPTACFAGLTMLDDDERATTAVFTDDRAPEIDAAQYRAGRGPCLDAWRTRSTVRLEDLARSCATYPEFSQACLERGIRSTLSLPLVAADRGMGALNLYSTSSAGFDADDERQGGALAAAASSVLANAVAYWGAYELGQQLCEAMASRAVIEQAKGILMSASPRLGPDDAFDLLRRASQREHVKLRDVAARVVERRSIAPRI